MPTKQTLQTWLQVSEASTGRLIDERNAALDEAHALRVENRRLRDLIGAEHEEQDARILRLESLVDLLSRTVDEQAVALRHERGYRNHARYVSEKLGLAQDELRVVHRGLREMRRAEQDRGLDDEDQG